MPPLPGLPWLAGGLLATGAVLALIGALLVVLAVRRAHRVPRVVVPSPRAPLPDGPTTPAPGVRGMGAENRP